MKGRVSIATYQTNNHVAKALVKPTQGKVFCKGERLVVRKHGFKNEGLNCAGFKNRKYNETVEFGYGRRVCS